MQKVIKNILRELEQVLCQVDQSQVDMLMQELVSAKTIVACGAGRVGMMTRAFVMRLGHLGFRAFMLGDATVPALSHLDVLLVSSGSGETQTIYDLAVIAKNNKARICLITGNPDSRIGRLADVIVQIKAPSKTKSIDDFHSIQPMTSLNEQSLILFFDALVLLLMEKLGETHETMWLRHSNLE